VRVSVIGAGVAGLTCAVELAERGVTVEMLERGGAIGAQSCSWHAGGMLAPWCERERTEPLVAVLGEQSLKWWQQRFPGTVRRGTLVVAHERDMPELTRFSQRTERFQWLDAGALGKLEPDLAGRYSRALFFNDEAHLDPRAALQFFANRLCELGGCIRFGVDGRELHPAEHSIIDCTGLAARQVLGELRGVKGEMILLRSREITLTRPVRLLHPRTPVYIVPREEGVFMVGATMIESDDDRRVSARSVLELLGAAYALHPAFAAAEIVELGTQVRPAFPDNLPRIVRQGRRLYVNGLYRHGFLLAPALAHAVAEALLHNRCLPGVMDEDSREPQRA
jgi:glycine oxidase